MTAANALKAGDVIAAGFLPTRRSERPTVVWTYPHPYGRQQGVYVVWQYGDGFVDGGSFIAGADIPAEPST